MKINNLLVIAGPNGIGKSTLIRRLKEGGLSTVAQKLQLGDIDSWKVLDPGRELLALKDSPINKVILHYNFIRNYPFSEDKVLQRIRPSEKIIWVTCWAPPDILIKRISHRRKWITRSLPRSLLNPVKLFKGPKRIKRLINIGRKRRIYNNQLLMNERYRRWFEYCNSQQHDSHWIIDINDLENPALMSRDQWLARDGNALII